MASNVIGKQDDKRKNIVVISFLLQSLTVWMDCGKAIWNRYFLLLLLDYGFSIAQVGVIKSWSLVAKAMLQLVVPALEDSGLFAKCFGANISSHVLVFLAALLSIPIFLSIESFCQPESIYTLTVLKGLISLLSVFGGLSDGIVARTIQKSNLSYSKQQSFHAIAWCSAVIVGGYLVDGFGYSIIFPLIAMSKVLVGCIVICLGRLCPLPRESSGDPFSSLKRGVLEIWANVFLIKILFFMTLWGFCFVVIETITFVQMDREFELNKFLLGVSSVFSVAGGLIVYQNASFLIRSLGHLNLIRLGIFTGVIFLFAHSFLTKETANLALPLCVIRGFSYAAIWAPCMDFVVSQVRNELITSVQALINFTWFTVGQGIGFFLWTGVYQQEGSNTTYFLCAGIFVVTGILFREKPLSLSVSKRFTRWVISATVFMPLLLLFSAFSQISVGMRNRVSLKQNLPLNTSNLNLINSWQSEVVHSPSLTPAIQRTPIPTHLQELVEGGKERIFNGLSHVNKSSSKIDTFSQDHMAKTTMKDLQRLRDVSKNTSLKQFPATIHEYIRFRMEKTNPKFYSHFADRLWVNQWSKVRRCNASVPNLLAFFSPLNISALQQFVAPATGAVVKLNHHAGGVTVLDPHTSLSAEKMKFYRKQINEKYSSTIEPHYTLVPHGVIIEEFLSALSGGVERPPDFKAYAFDGNISLVRVDLGRDCSGSSCKAKSLYLEPREFRRLPFSHHDFPDFQGSFPKPCGWEEAMQTVKCLSRGINFARIDVYIVKCETFLGEMTMTPMGGHAENSMAAQRYMAKSLKSWDIYPGELSTALL